MQISLSSCKNNLQKFIILHWWLIFPNNFYMGLIFPNNICLCYQCCCLSMKIIELFEGLILLDHDVMASQQSLKSIGLQAINHLVLYADVKMVGTFLDTTEVAVAT